MKDSIAMDTLLQQTIKNITTNEQTWMEFLKTASYNYKYSYEDILAIHAQKPGATAVGSAAIWKRLDRNLKENAVKIMFPQKSRRDAAYGYDIADTEGSLFTLWKYEKKQDDFIIQHLKKIYPNTSGCNNLKGILNQIVEDKILSDSSYYFSQFQTEHINDGLNLTKESLWNEFFPALRDSIYFMLAYRMGYLNETTIWHDYFYIKVFFSIYEERYASCMGPAVQKIGSPVLIEIGKAVKQYERERNELLVGQKMKRSMKHDSQKGKISLGEQNFSTGFQDGKRNNSTWEVRSNEEKLSQEGKAGILQENDEKGNTTGSHDRYSKYGNQTDGNIHGEIIEEISSTGSEYRTYGMGETHEPTKINGGGSDAARVDLQLEKEDFLLENQTGDFLAINVKNGIDEPDYLKNLLRTGGPDLSRFDIFQYFIRENSSDKRVDFLKNSYLGFRKCGGKGFILDDIFVNLWFDERGLFISKGSDTSILSGILNGSEILYSWNSMEEKIYSMIQNGEFLNTEEITLSEEKMIEDISTNLWYVYHDSYMNIPLLGTDFNGYPDQVEEIKDLLLHNSSRHEFLKNLREDVEGNIGDISKGTFARLSKIIKQIVEIDYQPNYPICKDNGSVLKDLRITEDEITYILKSGSLFQNSKYRIFEMAMKSPTKSEFAKFLSNEYGIGGYNHALSNSQSYVDHSPKGIIIKKGDLLETDDTILLKWSQVAERILNLIEKNNYLTKDEMNHYPQYIVDQIAIREKNELIIKFHDYFQKVADADINISLYEIQNEISNLITNRFLSSKNFLIQQLQDNILLILPPDNDLYIEGKEILKFISAYDVFEEKKQLAEAKVPIYKENDIVCIDGQNYIIVNITRDAILLGNEQMPIFQSEVLVDDFCKEMGISVSDLFPEEDKAENVSGLSMTEKTDDNTDVIEEQKAIEDSTNSEEKIFMIDDSAVEDVADVVSQSIWNLPPNLELTNIEFDKDIAHKNYELLQQLVPNLMEGTFKNIQMQHEGFTPIQIIWIDQNHLSISHCYYQDKELIYIPRMELYIDSEKQLVLSLNYENSEDGFVQDTYLGTDQYDDILQNRLNMFLFDWLNNVSSIPFLPIFGKIIHNNKLTEVFFQHGSPVFPEDYESAAEALEEMPEEVEEIVISQAQDSKVKDNKIIDSNSDNALPFQTGDSFLVGDKMFTVMAITDNEVHMSDKTSSDRPITAILSKEAAIKAYQSAKNNVTNKILPAGNYQIKDDNIGVFGPKQRYKNNVNAIRLLHDLESQNRLATLEEQDILAKYVGWGGIAEAFDKNVNGWSNEYEELKGLLSEEEYCIAKESSLTAFYTPPVVIRAIYNGLSHIGFTDGNILDPACGIGRFFGMLPDAMKKSNVYGVELDSISGRIAEYLYPDCDIEITGFENTVLPDNMFDVAIGNVPFGSFRLYDKRYDKYNFLIHDYFFAKALDKVRPGGIIAFITSKGTMDKGNDFVRKYIAERAELIGAIRLPDNLFYASGGTTITSDILFLQRRERVSLEIPSWVHVGVTEDGQQMNQYFIDHPEMVLGELKTVTNQYGKKDLACKAIPDIDFENLLSKAISNIHGTYEEYEDDIENLQDREKEKVETVPAEPFVENYGFTVIDGEIYRRENTVMYKKQLNDMAKKRVIGMIGIRDCVKELIYLQLENGTDEEIKECQQKLNVLYDDFIDKYGYINSRGNQIAFSEDSSYYLLCSLEVFRDNQYVGKADMFSKRTIKNSAIITSVSTASEALAVSISEKARVDLAYMSSLLDLSPEEIVDDLKGVIFMLPDDTIKFNNRFVTADEYLSGNVKDKLKEAESYAISHPNTMENNIAALKDVLPKDLDATEISIRLGATWIPVEYIQQFMIELFDLPNDVQSHVVVSYNSISDLWYIKDKNSGNYYVSCNSTYGTKRMNGLKILENTLNLKDVQVYDSYEEDGKQKRVINRPETTFAMQKQEEIKNAFAEWIWKDFDRREHLVQIYNDKFNNTVLREYSGEHITFHGISPTISLRNHQINAVARILYGGNTLIAHKVGAGKTFTMVAAAMEMKYLGLCQKSLFVVPNHLIEQWASEFLQLYPAAKLLVSTKKDFETANRKKFCARIATGEWDAIIIGHSQFEKIPLSAERQLSFIEDELDKVLDAIDNAKREMGGHATVKQLERTKKSLRVQMERLNNKEKKDTVITFEELGVDRLFIDEFHFYKNLFFYTKMRNIGGISNSAAQKSSDLFAKCRYMDEITNGKGLIGATGTPLTNSIAEMYTLQRYFSYDALFNKGLTSFDAWASTFGETVTAIELSPEGTGFRSKTRFSKFYNLPELQMLFHEFADVKTEEMLNLDVPNANYHTIVLEANDFQLEVLKELSKRADDVRNGIVDPSEDNMLKITNDGRKLALDSRLIDENVEDIPNSKSSVCAKNIVDIYEKSSDILGTQIVFCDLSTPKNNKEFNVYDDILDKLKELGIPEEEIAFIHDAKTDRQKDILFSKMRSGKIRVLLGSTLKMGAGTNVQDRLVAIHDLDCPWLPSDLEQRAGRGIRQGNMNSDVYIFRYVTKNTFDAYMFQLLENKQRFICQIMTSKNPVRVVEDIDGKALSYAEIKACCTGNPLIKEKMELDIEVNRLKSLKSSFMNNKFQMENDVRIRYPERINGLKQSINGYQEDMKLIEKEHYDKDVFAITIGNKTYDDLNEGGKALLLAVRQCHNATLIKVGSYRIFDIMVNKSALTGYHQLYIRKNMSYEVDFGSHPTGNITKINNIIKNIPKLLIKVQNDLVSTENQLKAAIEELKKDFPQEKELQSKVERLTEVDILLTPNKKEQDDLKTSSKNKVDRIIEKHREQGICK